MEYSEMIENMNAMAKQAKEIGYMTAIDQILNMSIDLETKIRIAETLKAAMDNSLKEGN